MRYATLFRRAWKVTIRSKRLLYFLFLPALAQVSVFTSRLVWQVYRYGVDFDFIKEEYMLSEFVNVFQFLSEKNLAPTLIIYAVLVVLIQYLLMPLIEGIVFLSVRQRFSQPKSYLSLRQKMLESGQYFFKMFELNALLRFFQLGVALIWIISIYRYTLGGMWLIIRPMVLVYFVLSIIVTFFGVYSPFFILFEGSRVRQAVRQSFSLSFLFFGQTLTLFFMMILLSLRIVLNVVLIFALPLLLFALLGNIGLGFSWIIIFVAGVVVLGLVAYFNALLDIFISAVWVRAFIALREKQKKLNHENEKQ